MRFNKLVGSLAAATISLGALTNAAHAQINKPLVSFGGDTPGLVDVTFTAGTGFLTTVTGGSAVSLTSGPGGNIEPDLDAFLSFGPLALQSTTTSGANGINIEAAFNGAGNAFTLSSGAGGTGTVYLSGNLGTVLLTGRNGGGTTQAFVDFNGVTYNGGTFLDQFLIANPGSNATGNFVLNLLTLDAPAGEPAPLSVNSSGSLNSFSSTQISGNFNATPVPEPSEWMAIGMATASVGGLMFRARLRRRRQTTVAA
ncbi:MAG: hypothetical protein H7Z41_02215 [Cytophagales bacterium]|nr:hypothetical protein [Armatimonadota bacterium]